MSQDPVVKRVIAGLRRVAIKARAAEVAAAGPKGVADDEYTRTEAAYNVAYAAFQAAREALDAPHRAWCEADELAGATEDDLWTARQCPTTADLLACDRQAVRMATQFALAPEPTPPTPTTPKRTPRKR